MNKSILALALLATLAACSSKEKTALSAKEQVDGIKQMCADNAEAMKQRQEAESLYSRLGGEAKIKEFVTSLLRNHQADKKISHYFENVPDQPFIDNVTAFLVTNSGGGDKYTGRNMTDVHRGFGITYDDFLVAGGGVQEVMTEFGYGKNEQQEAVCFLVSFVPQVVTN